MVCAVSMGTLLDLQPRQYNRHAPFTCDTTTWSIEADTAIDAELLGQNPFMEISTP
jgi:hypothetical protein